MISISFPINELPIAQVMDSTKQLLRTSNSKVAVVSITEANSDRVMAEIHMGKMSDGTIAEGLRVFTHAAVDFIKHNHGRGVDTGQHPV